MSNSYFQFKKFSIQQDQCGMKVCTDSCVLGAWFAEKIPTYSTILDIGSGTGLQMLMLAQKSRAKITGIEIDLPSCKQSKENIQESPWHDRLNICPGDVRNYKFPDRFDFIISNPPFFEGDLLSENSQDQVARHEISLNLEELLEVVKSNLDTGGSFGILLPANRTSYFEKLALDYGFYVSEALFLRQSSAYEFFRTILHLSGRKANNPERFELSIHKGSGHFTAEFIELMKDYYLYL
jgi:tRNA1Val (adenine37-N6)-methyltransferase